MTHAQGIWLLECIRWVLIAAVSVVVALLWLRMDRDVVQSKADIAAMKSYSDNQARELQERASHEQKRLENRWGTYLMPLLRQHHHAIQSLPLEPEHVQPLPEWLQEK